MTFTLTITMDGAAFEDDPELEIRSLLLRVGNKVFSGEKAGAIIDSNGNTCGRWEIV